MSKSVDYICVVCVLRLSIHQWRLSCERTEMSEENLEKKKKMNACFLIPLTCSYIQLQAKIQLSDSCHSSNNILTLLTII